MKSNVATNIRLPGSTYRALKLRSLRDGQPVAWHIREALDRYLDEGRGSAPSGDPFEGAIGIGTSGLGDLAEAHDRYLYGDPARSTRRRKKR